MRISELLAWRKVLKLLGILIHTLAKLRCNWKGLESMGTGRLVKYNRKRLEAYLWSTTVIRGL
jgi:hypothetical protein